MARAFLLAGVTIQLRGLPYKLERRFEDGVWEAKNLSTGRTCEFPIADLHEALRQGQLCIVPRDGARRGTAVTKCQKSPRWEAVSGAEQTEARRKLGYVLAALKGPRAVKHVHRAIDEHSEASADAKRPSPSSVNQWTSAYLSGGKDIVSLLPRHSAKGNKRSRIPEIVERKIEEAIEAIYLRPERPTLKDTVLHAISLVTDHNKLLASDEPRLPLPTIRTVRSVLAHYSPFDVCSARYGREYATRKFSPVLGEGKSNACLEVIEIDHTPTNGMLIDERTALPLGRAWLTVAIDRWSRAILGYSLSFDPPSYLTVMRCLRHAILPKSYLKKDYPEIKGDWPMYGLMSTLVVDNGAEFHGDALESAAVRNGITLQFCERKAPHKKGKIERVLGTMNREIFHPTPGTTFANVFDRGDYKPGKTAVLTLQAAHQAIHNWIVDVYHARVHRGLRDTPLNAWASEMAAREIAVPDDIAEFDAQLGVPVRRKLTRNGITLNNLTYNSPDCAELLVKSGGPLEVTVRYAPDDMGYVYVENETSGRHVKVPVLERHREYACGLTKWQHDRCERYVLDALRERNDVISLAEAKRRIRQITENALAEKSAKHRKLAARHKNATRKSPGQAEQPVKPDDTTPLSPPSGVGPGEPIDSPALPAGRSRLRRANQPTFVPRQRSGSQDQKGAQ